MAKEKPRPQSFAGKPVELDPLFSLEDHDEFLRALGVIAVTWSNLEMILAQYYAVVVLGEGAAFPTKHVVVEALEAVPTWHSKAKLLVRATEIRFDPPTAKALSKLLFSVKDIQDDRNEVLHGRWFTSPDAPGKWIHGSSILGPLKVYDLPCLTQIYDDIWEALVKLREFFMALKERTNKTSAVYASALQEVLAGFQPEQPDHAVEDNLGGA